jgi:dihydrofolate reductase
MRISAICAMSENRAIGKDNKLPWHLPADLKHFKNITMGKPVLMGRKTYESIGRPLPGRCNIVMTHHADYQAPGCVVVQSIEEALAASKDHDELFIIGGATLYQEMLPQTQRIYMTLIHQQIDGDTFFPALNSHEWQQVECIDHPEDAANPYRYSFIIFDRIESSHHSSIR